MDGETSIPTPTNIIYYAAGLFDGEGFVTIQRLRGKRIQYNLIVGIKMADDQGINHLAKYFGGSIHKYERENKSYLPITSWTLYGYKACKFLELILPALKVKARVAEVGIIFAHGYLTDTSISPKRPIDLKRVSFAEECRQKLQTIHTNRASVPKREISKGQLSLI
jgi:hypothetical protein